MATNNKYGLTYDVIIIGSGVAGALVAYKLAKEKVRVLILEAGGIFPYAHRVGMLKS